MRRAIVWTLVATMGLGLVATANGLTMEFRDLTTDGDSSLVADAFLRKDSPNYNAGITKDSNPSNTSSRWYPTGHTKERHSLYWWDLSGITASLQPGEVVQVTSATFSIWMKEEADIKNGAAREGNISRVIGDAWIEGVNNGGAANNGEPTWNSRKHNSALWEVAGATGASDVDMTLTFVVDAPDATGATFRTDINVTDIAKTWLENGAANRGLLLHGGNWNDGTNRSFLCYAVASSEILGYLERRPLLTVEYEIVPEPAAAGLFGLSWLLLRRRR